jgi:hypothetical protein
MSLASEKKTYGKCLQRGSWQTSAVYSHTRFPRFLQIKPVHLLQVIEGFLAVISGAFCPPPQNKYIERSSKTRQDISDEKEGGCQS